ncbi:MAG TPA: hypothetical protein VNA21_07020 [Steroidobacteraceae bacterium]|nr:hypothetical protein [Steroidobacteraceae bacterium]
MRRVLWVAICATLLGCSGSGDGLDENGRPLDSGPLPLVPTFASIQQNVFTPSCTRCHAGAAAPAGLRLDEASSYAMLVNVASVEVPGLRRVRPGDPDLSYLIQKLEGRAAVGARMPLNSPPLPQATIDVIKQWIRDGAQRAAASTSPQSPATISAIAPLDQQIINSPPGEIIVSSAAALDTTAFNTGSVVLKRSGGDGSFEEGNEVALSPMTVEVLSSEPTVISIKLTPNQWASDSYQLTVAGAGSIAIGDRSGGPIDGDLDGKPGGNFVMHFELGRQL